MLMDIYINFHTAYLFSYPAAFYSYERAVLWDSSLNAVSFRLDREYVDNFINQILAAFKLRESF